MDHQLQKYTPWCERKKLLSINCTTNTLTLVFECISVFRLSLFVILSFCTACFFQMKIKPLQNYLFKSCCFFFGHDMKHLISSELLWFGLLQASIAGRRSAQEVCVGPSTVFLWVEWGPCQLLKFASLLKRNIVPQRKL